MSTIEDFKAEKFLLNNFNLATHTDFELNVFQNLDTVSIEDNNSFNITLLKIGKERKIELTIDATLDSLHKINVQLDNLHKINNTMLSGLNSFGEAVNIDFKESSKTLQTAIKDLTDYQNIAKDFIGNDTIVSDIALNTLNLTSNTINQLNTGINNVLTGENNFGKYKTLRDSILSYDYLISVKEGTVKEPVSLEGLSFEKAFQPTANKGRGPSLYMLKVSLKEGEDRQKINEDFLTKTFNLKRIPQITNFVIDSSKSKIYKKQLSEERTSLIHDIILNADFQMQYYIAYFTKKVNGEESLVKLYTKTLKRGTVIDDVTNPKNADSTVDNRYYYFFYTDVFNFTPVKKTTANLKYGAFTTVTALNKPEGKNTFSFNVASDLELTFWEFISKNGLGLNSNKAYYSNNSKKPIKDKINLNIIMHTSHEAPDYAVRGFVSNIGDKRMNKFVLEDIEFSELKNLNFSQQFNQMKLNVSGTYRKLKWYHNIPFSEI